MHKIVEGAQKYGLVSFDVEHDPNLNPNSPTDFKLWGCSFAIDPSEDENVWYLRDTDEIREVWSQLSRIPDLEWVAHNGKYDVKCGNVLGFPEPQNLRCTMIAANMLHDNLRENQVGLKPLSKMFLGRERDTFKDVSLDPDSERFSTYSKDDARDTYDIYTMFKSQLIDQKLFRLFSELMCPASIMFSDVEQFGMRWDCVEARKQGRILQRIAESSLHAIRQVGGDINPRSPKQLQKLFFGTLGLPTDNVRRTKTGFSTDEKVMTMFAPRHPVCAQILRYRTATKALSSYVSKFTKLAEQDPESRLHATFWVTSSTGRSRATNPPVQTIPVRFHDTIAEDFTAVTIRRAFVPRPGWKFLVADFSQIELRLVAHLSKDPVLLDAYRSYSCKCGAVGSCDTPLMACPSCGTVEGFIHGKDIHSITTENIDALKGDRNKGKTTNFAVIYDCSAKRLHYEHPGLCLSAWQEVIDGWFYLYQGVRRWHGEVEAVVRRSGQIRDLFGRLRRFPKHEMRDQWWRVKKQAINFVPQATASELSFLCATKLRKLWMKKGLWGESIQIVNLVHDELDVEVREDVIEEASADIIKIMQSSIQISVPIFASIKQADNWYDGK